MNKTQPEQVKLIIRKGVLQELEEISVLFSETIDTICSDDYNSEQIAAWKSSSSDQQRWYRLIENQYFIIAILNGKIVGFASLDQGNYVDVMYVHRHFQRQGIAQRLYSTLENEAKRQKSTFITADVSKTAKPFFEANGFKVTTEQIQVRNKVEIPNYNMQKQL
ncbi:GNAT family N-acetyltransferase [Sphingobacterium sp.]|uniref:GNAT family N-acetyltransferase n=1 Tax=Sphingobacterium sp. TaxID=341027 RepID=UPI00289652C7|nr:GNAT family N-acetyltransferase [Sphingobacterium sp.]